MDRSDPWASSVPDHYLCYSAQESPSLKHKPIPTLRRTLMLPPCSCLLLFHLHLVLKKTCQIHNPTGQRKASLQLQGQLSHEAHQGLLGILKSTIKRGIKTASLSYPFGHDHNRTVGGPRPTAFPISDRSHPSYSTLHGQRWRSVRLPRQRMQRQAYAGMHEPVTQAAKMMHPASKSSPLLGLAP